MPRRFPVERKWMIKTLKWKARKKDISGPVFVAIMDRIAKLDGLYDAELTKPRERPGTLPEVPAVPPPDPKEAEDLEAKKLLDEFNRRHYGGEHVRTDTTAATTDQSISNSNPASNLG